MDLRTMTQTPSRATKWLWVLLMLVGVGVSAVTQAGTVTYVYTDAQGTPLAKADANGNIIATFDYAPYGAQALGTPPSGPGYTGHVNDPDTGLVYMQARYYDPATGRFLSVDPVGPSPGNTFNFNRYGYANNNPINHTDPDGRQSVGEMINSGAAGCGAVSCAGWAVLHAAWTITGAEPVSQFADRGWSGSTVGDKANAAIAIAGVLPIGRVAGAVGKLAEGASAVERASAIAGTMSARTQRAVTISVIETKEGTRVVSSSEGALRPAARAALGHGEVAGMGAAGTHAEVNGINAARGMGLTPTGAAASRPICASCAQSLEQQGIEPLSRLKQ